ncbi:MAG: hypothetical protein KA821_11985 [Chitinophagaceae bacterium]|nr:hypothetical protein [Chitinophagaceae bacterium]
MNRFLAALLLSIIGLMGLTRRPAHTDLTETELPQLPNPVIVLESDQDIHEVLEASGWLIGRTAVSATEKTNGKSAEPVRNIF